MPAGAKRRANRCNPFTPGVLASRTHRRGLGTDAGLAEALAPAATARSRRVIRSVAAADDAASFLDRSCDHANRVGPVVHRYS
jgi:hypothetical protein